MGFGEIPAIWVLLAFLLLVVTAFFVLGRFQLRVAYRYLVSTHKRNAVNLITRISIGGISLVTAALILVLSVFNGFHLLIQDIYGQFDPSLKVVADRGQTFPDAAGLCSRIASVDGVELATPVIESKALVRYNDKQHIVTVKGVKEDYTRVTGIESLVVEGDYGVGNGYSGNRCVLGTGVAAAISASLRDFIHPLELYAVSGEGNLLTDPEKSLRSEYFFPAGFFSVQKEYDEKYVLVDYASAEKLFSREGLATSIEIRLKSGVSPREAKTLVQGIAGQGFTVMTGMEQHQTLYEVMENEKLIGYLVVTLVLLLSAVTVVGSLSMIVLEKTRDISIMRSYGATTSQILKVFLAVGFFIGMISSVSGCLLGFAIGTAQQKWGFVKLGAGENFIVENFPIHMNPSDFFWVFLTVFSLAMLAALYPAWKASSLRIVEGLRK